MRYSFQAEQWVPYETERIFRFFANPSNLPRIMPPASGTELLALRLKPPPVAPPGQTAMTDTQPLAGIGSEIVTSFRILPFLPLRAEWVALITEFEWNHHFADEQKKGPFKCFYHRHEILPERRDKTNGSLVRDVIEYDPGCGWLGALAQKLFIADQLRRTFAYRQHALARLLSPA
jgi:ligand-binding SRPBCC domain-containing protein